jgi:hypothetical protein
MFNKQEVNILTLLRMSEKTVSKITCNVPAFRNHRDTLNKIIHFVETMTNAIALK